MKVIKYIFLFLLITSLSCSKNRQYKNPYLNNLSFSVEINMDLPEYSTLKFANNSVLVHQIGIKGVIVFNTGNAYIAFEASDPNHFPNNCSQMQPNQFTCKCQCENNEYSLYNGHSIKGKREYPMKTYKIHRSNNLLRIYN